MANYGFEIKLNDNHLCRAGFENTYHVLDCIIGSFKRKADKSEQLFLRVGGLNSDTHQHVLWSNTDLKTGDRILIEIVTDKFEKPSKVEEEDSDQTILEKKNRVLP